MIKFNLENLQTSGFIVWFWHLLCTTEQITKYLWSFISLSVKWKQEFTFQRWDGGLKTKWKDAFEESSTVLNLPQSRHLRSVSLSLRSKCKYETRNVCWGYNTYAKCKLAWSTKKNIS